MNDHVLNLLYYVGSALFGLFLLSLGDFSAMWFVALTLTVSSAIVAVVSERWMRPALIVSFIALTGMLVALVITFLEYAFG